MKTRAALGILAAAGLATAAHAQESVTYVLTWTEVNAGTATPSTNSAPGQAAGRIDPGEGARIALRVQITPGIGTTATYTPPPPPGLGTIAGLGSIFFDLLGTNLNGGTWSNINRNPTPGNPGPAGWGLGDPGTGQPSGNLINAQAGQFTTPGATANGSNPIVDIWRGTWNPSSYSTRTASILSAGAVTAGPNHSSILIQYGLDANGNPAYVAKFVSGIFGNTGNIPIAPAPSSLALLGLGAMVAGRRRR